MLPIQRSFGNELWLLLIVVVAVQCIVRGLSDDSSKTKNKNEQNCLFSV